MTATQIREFRYPDDYLQASQLWQGMERGIKLGRSDEPIEIEKKLQRDPDLFLVAEADGKVIGTIIGGYDGRRGLIYHLLSAPRFADEGWEAD